MITSHNPYYSPEKCGLTVIDSIDTAGSYEFDMIVVWRKDDDNTLWYATDSGCSCPTPFYDVELIQITRENWFGFEQAVNNHYNITEKEAHDLLVLVKKELLK